MQELKWKELVNGESDVDADDINKLAEYIKELNKNKVDTVTGKGLSTEDFTTELKTKLELMPEGGANITVDSELSETSENPVQNKVITAELNLKANKEHAFDGIYTFDKNPLDTTDGDVLAEISRKGIYKIYYTYNEPSTKFYIGILKVAHKEYFIDEDFSEGIICQTFTNMDGETYLRESMADTTKYVYEWEKVSVSQNDLDTAIGDIETSLENIIKKYGLGGDSV